MPEVPQQLCKNLPLSSVVAELVCAAIENKRTPVSPELTQRMAIAFDDEQYALIESLPEFSELSKKELAYRLGAYCNAQIKAILEDGGSVEEEHPFREAQQQFYNNLLACNERSKIGVVEAATGIGKSWAMIVAAQKQALAGNTPVVISCPSVNGLYQMAKELSTVNAHPGIQEMIGEDISDLTYSFVLGRSNFISEETLRVALKASKGDEGEWEGVQRWLDGGAKPLHTSHTISMGDHVDRLAYLYEDLEILSPTLAKVPGVQLSSSETDCPAAEIYDSLRSRAHDADIIFATHAMVGYDNMFRFVNKDSEREATKILPDMHTLYVDEAHQLEPIFAQIDTVQISPRMLHHYASKTECGSEKQKRDLAKAVKQAVSSLQALGKSSVRVWPNMWVSDEVEPSVSHAFDMLEKVSTKLDAVLKSKGRHKGDPNVKHLVNMLYALRRICSKKQPVSIDFSPVMKWPRIEAEPVGLAKKLDFLWESKKAAALVSATLYLPNAYGKLTADFISKSLNLPKERLMMFPPIRPSWVTDPVTLYAPKNPEVLCPPSEGSFENDPVGFEYAMDMWLREIADRAARIAQSAQSGTLLLFNSYDVVEKLGKKLAPQLGSRLMLQSRAASVSTLKRTFTEEALGDRRPVWIGVGQAWTGLDISAKGEKDPLMDVVIGRLPFKKAKGVSTAGDKKGRNATAFDMRQGIGRLVRNDRCANKKLWVLDGRIFSDKKWYAPYRALLDVYDKRKVFE
jgi:ATP-dependent DNA helicase DinG